MDLVIKGLPDDMREHSCVADGEDCTATLNLTNREARRLLRGDVLQIRFASSRTRVEFSAHVIDPVTGKRRVP